MEKHFDTLSARSFRLPLLGLSLIALAGACRFDLSPPPGRGRTSALVGDTVRVRVALVPMGGSEPVEFGSRQLRVWRSGAPDPVVVQSDASGEVDLPLPSDFDPVESWIAIDVPGCQLWLERFLGGRFEQTAEVPSVWLLSASPIEVSVVDEDGNAVVDAEVSTTGLGCGTFMPWFVVPESLRRLLSARTDERGVARVRRGGPGQIVWASAEVDGRLSMGELELDWSRERDVSPSRPLVLAPTLDATLRFVDAVHRSPIAGVLVTPATRQPEHRPAKSDDRGVVRMASVACCDPPSFYVQHPDPSFGVLYLEGDNGVVASGKLDLEVPLCAPVAVRARVVDGRSGEPLFAPSYVEYAVSRAIQPGWELRFSDQVMCTDPRAGVELLAPPGVVDFRVESRGPGSRPAYQGELRREIRAGTTEIELGLERQPGILFRNRSSDSDIRAAFERWGSLSLSVGIPGSDELSGAPKGEYWFCPVEAWGDRVRVRAEWRSWPAPRVLLDRAFEARPESWPVVLDLELDR